MTVCRNPYILFPLLELKCLEITPSHAKETRKKKEREKAQRAVPQPGAIERQPWEHQQVNPGRAIKQTKSANRRQ